MARNMIIIQFFLLIATLILIFYSIVYGIEFSTIKKLKSVNDNKCNQIWDELQFKVINDRSLKEVFDICEKDDITLNGRSNNYYLLKHSLETFNCSRPLKSLDAPRPYVALASLPGSGNTWTRLLIETVTGIETGSVYQDTAFDGSKFCPARGKVFIVKTHRNDNNVEKHGDCVRIGITTLNFSRAIYIMRNPYNAILAEFNRQIRRKSIMSSVRNESFNTTKWSKFVKIVSNKWSHMTLYWLQRKDIPVFVLVYERLMENVVLEIYNLTKFLNYKMQFKHVYCLSSNMTSKYKRNNPPWLTKENVYNNDLREIVNSAIQYVNNYVDSKWNISNVLDSYILPASTTPE